MCSVFDLKIHSANYELKVKLRPCVTVKFDQHSSYLGIWLDRSLSFGTRVQIQEKILIASGTHQVTDQWGVGNWIQNSKSLTLESCLTLAFAAANYCAPAIRCRSAHAKHI